LRTDAGAVTVDTFIRADLTRYFAAAGGPRNASSLATWLLANAEFTMWWKPAIDALAAFVFARGEARRAIPLAVMIGRDCDTTATTAGSWCGALGSESTMPREWASTVCEVNRPEIDIRGLAEQLLSQPNVPHPPPALPQHPTRAQRGTDKMRSKDATEY